MINSFEELVIWQKARALTKSIYLLLQDNRDYGFRDQIQRASVSIMSNIAEGFGRNKSKFAKDYSRARKHQRSNFGRA